MEHVTAMDHKVHFPGSGGCQGPVVIGQKVMPPPAAFHTGPGRKVETQVGVG